ncbi:hypothetical protein F9278_27700 [Streptomyces phaeolivaceus]|uniref:Uncharacterized protein n=1 Tax=Streptomyces phaeolivaceus TaxID=2653200 RepID=A0A5P8K7L1_9ACTN|nr:hypothetical protein [Streptomyces phaeolivaceus]QFQ99303.1 hypothetical protein F9278_27700 [Streptomyces phaeolivaceus]
MSNPMVAYRVLIRAESNELTQALKEKAPPKAPGQWILALLDISCTDYYPVNQEPGIGLEARLLFASRLLEFVEQELDLPDPIVISRAYMKVARKAIEDGALQVPPSLHADAVVASMLQRFTFTRQQAVDVAETRRSRYLDALTAGLEEEEFLRAVCVDGASELVAITALLPTARWFQGKITDKTIADELNAWLDTYAELELGDAVAELLDRRNREQQ